MGESFVKRPLCSCGDSTSRKMRKVDLILSHPWGSPLSLTSEQPQSRDPKGTESSKLSFQRRTATSQSRALHPERYCDTKRRQNPMSTCWTSLTIQLGVIPVVRRAFHSRGNQRWRTQRDRYSSHSCIESEAVQERKVNRLHEGKLALL